MSKGRASFSKKVNASRNEMQLGGINQFSTSAFADNPETTSSVNGSFTKKIYRFSTKLKTRVHWFNYFQTLNNASTSSDRNNQKIRILLKTAHKKWLGFSFVTPKDLASFQV